jgi:hypothetical protein
VKWDAGDNIVNPVFTGVTISNEMPEVISDDKKVEFIGNYSPVVLTGGDASNLYLGAENKLYWPTADDKTLNAFRAYFHVELGGDQHVREIRLNLDSTTGVESVQGLGFKVQGAGAWFDLFGRKLNGKPTVPGIYMNNGKKIAITK